MTAGCWRAEGNLRLNQCTSVRQVWANSSCIIHNAPLREKLEAKPWDDICQREAHLFLDRGTSLQTGVKGWEVFAWGGSIFFFFSVDSVSFTFIHPFIPLILLHCCFFSPVRFNAALSDNTLEAILELISLIGNKLPLFLQLWSEFLSNYK